MWEVAICVNDTDKICMYDGIKWRLKEIGIHATIWLRMLAVPACYLKSLSLKYTELSFSCLFYIDV